LDYLQARYYDPSRGQFLSQDPVFLGDPKEQDLSGPQSLNSYSYANDNPVTGKDPTGRQLAMAAPAVGGASVSAPLGWIALALSAIILALTVISFSGGQGVHAVPSVVNSPAQIVQSVSISPMPTMLRPLVNTGASAGRQSGATVAPINSVPWANVNL
jgi:RHS repeat-associated protein